MFWREWDVFGVPGGLPFFLAFNAAVVLLLAIGLAHVAQNDPSSKTFSLLCAATGGLTVAVHSVFLLMKPEAFAAPTSLCIFGAIAFISTVQAWVALRRRARP